MKIEQYNLSELLISLSNAMDLASPVLMKHQQRTAYICWQMGRLSDLDYQRQDVLFLAAILHDIGALTTDEKASLHQMEMVDASRHCRLGEHIYQQVNWLKPAAEIVRDHHTPWLVYKEALSDRKILEAQILFCADMTERLIKKDEFILHQKDRIIKTIEGLSGTDYHPQVVELFKKASKSERFWLDLESPRLSEQLKDIFIKRSIYLTLKEMRQMALLFKNIIDFRSPFTAMHSTGVSACASKLSSYFGFSEHERLKMEIAGYMHDIGKLAISNSLLEKPASLTESEFAVMKQHVYQSYQILNNISGFETITEWAVLHHEKLDGSGYPFAYSASEISLGARIFAVSDIFTALSEDRPYRKAMADDKIVHILETLVAKNHLDPQVVAMLIENRLEISDYVNGEKEKAYLEYNEFIHKIEVR